MRTFKPGDYVRIENEKIPAMIELLRVNGWHTEDGIWNSCAIWYNHSNFFKPITNPGVNAATNELSIHDFLITALRLKEGDGMRADMSTPGQRKHITEKLEMLGIKQYSNIEVDLRDMRQGFYFNLKEWIGSFNTGHVTNHIDYTEWCRRLNVEPVGSENNDHLPEAGKTITLPNGTTVDLTKPIEVSNADGNYYTKDKAHYVGVDADGMHVIHYLLPSGEYTYSCYKYIRNKPEPEFKPGEKVWGKGTTGIYFIAEFIKKGGSSYWVKTQKGSNFLISTIRPAIVDGVPVYPPFND